MSLQQQQPQVAEEDSWCPPNDRLTINGKQYCKYSLPVLALDYILIFSMIGLAWGTSWSVAWHYLLTPRLNWMWWGAFIQFFLFKWWFTAGTKGVKRRNSRGFVIAYIIIYGFMWAAIVSNVVVQWYYWSCDTLSNSCASCNDNTPPADILAICNDSTFQRVRGGNIVFLMAVTVVQFVGFVLTWIWITKIKTDNAFATVNGAANTRFLGNPNTNKNK